MLVKLLTKLGRLLTKLGKLLTRLGKLLTRLGKIREAGLRRPSRVALRIRSG